MDDNQVIKLIRIAIEITIAKGEKTITPHSVQTAIRIMYMDEPEIKSELVTAGTLYSTTFLRDDKVLIHSLKKYNKLVREHIASGIYDTNYKLSSTTIPYLCGVVDKSNGYTQF